MLITPGGGIGYTGQTTCVSGYTCQNFSEWYSQCNPGTATSVVPTPAPTPTPTPPPTPPSSAPPASCPSPSGTSLDAKIKAKGRDYFGTCTDRNTLSDPAYEAIVIAEYGQVTPENSMKWESTESEPPPVSTQVRNQLIALPDIRGNYTMGDADFLVAWAQQHGKLIRGHTLVWHSQLPACRSPRHTGFRTLLNI